MSTTENYERPELHVGISGGQGVQIGTGNHQINHYFTIQLSRPEARHTAIAGPRDTSQLVTGQGDERLIMAVPRTREQLDEVIEARPLAWENLAFAGASIIEIGELEDRYTDYLLGYAPRSGNPVYEANFLEFYNIQLRELLKMGELFERIYGDEARKQAMGAKGVAGDPVRILHLAKRYISVYDEFLRWTERLRGTPVPQRYRRLIAILARASGQPISEIRRFVYDYAEQIERVPHRLNAGESVQLNFAIKLDLSSSITGELNSEFAGIKVELIKSSARKALHARKGSAA